jgi:hypothetical protein
MGEGRGGGKIKGASMKNRMFQGLAAVVAFLLLTGFGRGTPIYNVQSAAIPASPAATMENIEKAIIRAGLTLGWQVTPREPGKAEAVLVLRTHRAVVDITYDTKSYSINYKDSINLDYDAQDKTIHSNYNGWIRNLDKAIRAQVLVL